MTDQAPIPYVPMDVAEEVGRLREDLAAIRAMLEGMKPPEPEWFTVKEAAAKEGVSEATVNRWVQRGDWEAKGSGSARRVRPV